MKLKRFTILLLILLNSTLGISQVVYDTIITGDYEKLKFSLGNGTLQLYEVNEIAIDIRDGIIESSKHHTDTIGIKHDTMSNTLEVVPSDKTWIKLLFGRDCAHIAKEVNKYPSILFKMNESSNQLSFADPALMGEFLTSNYTKRLECIDTLEDPYMKKYINNNLRQIENDSVNIFTTAFSSHFAHIHALLDLNVPTENGDSIVCKISATNSERPIEFLYETSKSIMDDATIFYEFSDTPEQSNTAKKQFVNALYKPFEKYPSEEDQENNKIRLASMTDEDRSEITLSEDGALKSYLRIMQSYMLDANLNPKYSFYNYEIKVIATSNK